MSKHLEVSHSLLGKIRFLLFARYLSQYMATMNVDRSFIRRSSWKSFADPSSIVVAPTRYSGGAPVYGLLGLFRCTQRAVEAFTTLYGELRAVRFSIPRTSVSSRHSFFDDNGSLTTRAGRSLAELWLVLGTVEPGRLVYLLCISFDAFTTNVNSYVHVGEKWGT